MVHALFWDPDPTLFYLPFFHFPVLWYGFFFALGFWLASVAFIRIVLVFLQIDPQLNHFSEKDLRNKAQKITDSLTLYVFAGTLLGARLGHFIFYESPSFYLSDPLEFFRFRNGGLASHGAVLGILLAVYLWSRKAKKSYPQLSWVRILDFLAAPAALAGACIRIGNFFNQEILGTPSQVPWAVVFGHPADGSLPLPRHPVQIYEAGAYLGIFCLLFFLSRKLLFIRSEGKLIGLFLILVFGFRFLFEFLKTEQSRLLELSSLTMGQILSLPVLALGFFFYFYSHKKVRK